MAPSTSAKRWYGVSRPSLPLGQPQDPLAERPHETDDLGRVGRGRVKAGGEEPRDDPRQPLEAAVLGRRDEACDELAASVDHVRPTIVDLVDDRLGPALDLGDPDRPGDVDDLAILPAEPTNRRGLLFDSAATRAAQAGARVVDEIRVDLEAVECRQRAFDRDPALRLVVGDDHGGRVAVLVPALRSAPGCGMKSPRFRAPGSGGLAQECRPLPGMREQRR